MSLADAAGPSGGHVARAASMREAPSFRRGAAGEGEEKGRPERPAPRTGASSISRRMEMLQEAASRPARASVILEEDMGLPRRRASEVPSMRDLARFPMPPAPPMPSRQKPFGSF
ncbi:hypothetical protein HDZ31DRAFT_69871 [Schizophyllum fasciatum]